MKKLISFLLVLCLTACVVPALARSKLIGPWYQVWIKDKKTGSVYGNAAATSFSALNLADDDTALLVLQSSGDKDSHKYIYFWRETRETVVLSDMDTKKDVIELKKEGDELVWDKDGSKIYYSMEQDKQFPMNLPETKTAEKAKSFNGSWVPIRNILVGVYANELKSVKTQQLSIMEIKNGTVEEVTTETDGSETRVPYKCKFEDGEMNGSVRMSDMSVAARFQLADDNMMLLTMTANGMTMHTVYQRLPDPVTPLSAFLKLPDRIQLPVAATVLLSAVTLFH